MGAYGGSVLECAAQLFSPKEAGYSCSVPAIVAVTVPPLLTVTPAGKLVRHGQLARPCASAKAARHAAASARSAIGLRREERAACGGSGD